MIELQTLADRKAIDSERRQRREPRSLPRVLALATCVAVSLVLASGAEAQNFGPVRDADFRDGGNPDTEKAELGRLLFFDKILSGKFNRRL